MVNLFYKRRRGVNYMDIEKNFFKTFLKNFDEISFRLKFWDSEEIKIGPDEPKFRIILKNIYEYLDRK